MRSFLVVVLDKFPEDSLKMALPKMRMWSRHSRRAVLTNRSAKAFAMGARIGARITRTASE